MEACIGGLLLSHTYTDVRDGVSIYHPLLPLTNCPCCAFNNHQPHPLLQLQQQQNENQVFALDSYIAAMLLPTTCNNINNNSMGMQVSYPPPPGTGGSLLRRTQGALRCIATTTTHTSFVQQQEETEKEKEDKEHQQEGGGNNCIFTSMSSLGCIPYRLPASLSTWMAVQSTSPSPPPLPECATREDLITW